MFFHSSYSFSISILKPHGQNFLGDAVDVLPNRKHWMNSPHHNVYGKHNASRKRQCYKTNTSNSE